jgi:hypothetical protein
VREPWERAILPALSLVASIAIVGFYIVEESDEFERSALMQSMLWGVGVALAIGSVWGSLEGFANAPHRSAFYAYLSFWIVNATSQVFHPPEVPMKNRLRVSPRGTWLVPGRPCRTSRGLAPIGQCHRDRQVRSLPSSCLQTRSPLQHPH